MATSILECLTLFFTLLVSATQVIALWNGQRQAWDPEVADPRQRVIKAALSVLSLVLSTAGTCLLFYGRPVWPAAIILSGLAALIMTAMMKPTNRMRVTVQHRASARTTLGLIIAVEIGLAAAAALV